MSEQTEKTTEFPALSAYQKAILTAMEIPLFAARTDIKTDSAKADRQQTISAEPESSTATTDVTPVTAGPTIDAVSTADIHITESTTDGSVAPSSNAVPASGHTPSLDRETSSSSALPNKLIPHPTMTITSDLQLFLADLRPDIFVFLNDEVVLDERGIGLPAELHATHKKQVWALLKAHLADTSA